MAPYRLRAGLSYCLIGSRAVFLDLAASRYFLLEGAGAECLATFAEGRASGDEMDWLVEQGLIEPGDALPMRALAPRPATSLHDRSLGTPRPWLLVEAIAVEAGARRRLANQALGALLEPSGLADADADPDRCRPVAVAIERASRYRDATDQCLVRGLAMRAMLARRGLPVDLVIGVMLPFAAHCWIQSGTTVLSDPLDRVANFTPLLTVR
ncbi:lasso peptide biosynthesis B2 protein [Sphingopyxis panaciterrae]